MNGKQENERGERESRISGTGERATIIDNDDATVL